MTALEGTVLENVDSIKYLGVTITSDLKWNSHIRNVCSKANRILGFLRRNLFSCPQDVKEAAYKSMVRLSGTGMNSLILSSPLLNCQTIVYLNLLPL